MELYMPISISKHFLAYFLALAAPIAISALNYAGLTKVPHIVIFIASPTLLVLHSLWEEAQIWELERQNEELRAKNRRLRAQVMTFEHAIEELDDRSDDLDDEAKILARIEKIKALQEFGKTIGS